METVCFTKDKFFRIDSYLGYHFCLMILLQISGSLYDAIGNYESGFYFSGTMIFISGVMLFVLPWMQRRQAAQNLVSGHPSLMSRNFLGIFLI
jgi:hypothetical protein